MPRNQPDRDDFDLRELILVVRRYWRFVAYPAVLCLLIGALYLVLAPSSYTATARLLINPNRAAGSGDIRPDSMIEKAYLDTQVEVLSSQQLAETVVRDHGFVTDPELSAQGWRALLPQWVTDALLARSGTADPAARAFDAAVVRFHRRTIVNRVGATYIVEVSFTAGSRERAAAFANAVCDTFVAAQRADMKDTFSRDSAALDQEITRLEAKAADAERAAEEYRVQHDLLGNAGQDETERQLADLNQQWIAAQSLAGLARDRLAQARALTVDTIVQSRPAVLAEVPNTTVISGLARSLANVRGAPPDAGAPGSAPAATPDDAAGRTAALAQELAKAVRFYQDAYGLAQSHEASLRRDLDTAYEREKRNAAQRAHLRDLDTQVVTLRGLYNDRIKRRFEMQPQEQTQPLAAAIVGRAKPPLDRSSPVTVFVLGIAGLIGGVFGGGVAFVRHQLDDSLHTPSDVEDALGLRCLGIMPRMPSSRRVPDAGTSGQLGRTLHNVRAAIDLSGAPRAAKTVGVISALPKEGRTFFATSLDRYLSGLGHRVLRICVDPPHGGPADRASPEPGAQSIHFAEDDGQPHDFRAGARRLHAVLDSVCGGADYIIVDLPPCTASMEIFDAALAVDRFILIAAARRTSRAKIIDAMKAHPAMTSRLLGVVLS